jgi:hypothetical protein
VSPASPSSSKLGGDSWARTQTRRPRWRVDHLQRSTVRTYRYSIWLPSGKLTVCYWKWPFIVSVPTKKWWFSIVMLVYNLPSGNLSHNYGKIHHRNSVFSHEMVLIFHSYVAVYQRVQYLVIYTNYRLSIIYKYLILQTIS